MKGFYVACHDVVPAAVAAFVGQALGVLADLFPPEVSAAVGKSIR
jgi:hypothetical protein